MVNCSIHWQLYSRPNFIKIARTAAEINYGDFYIFQDGGHRHLAFSKFQIFNGQNGQEGGTAPLCQIVSKSLQARPRYRDFSIFQDGSRRHLGFAKFEIFNVLINGQEGRTASPCQMSSKSLEPRPRYASFNIMLVWLENAYSRPLLDFFGAHFPQMMSLIVLTPKRTISGLNHAIWAINREYFPIDFWMGLTRVHYFPLV